MSRKFFLVAASLCLLASSVQAQEEPVELTPEQAVERALQQNPDLRALRLETERASLLLEREEHARTPVWTSDAGYRFGFTPVLTPEGTRQVDSSGLAFGTRLSHVFSHGTQLGVSANLGRSVRDSAALGDLGAPWDTSIGVDVSQPILRGFGNDIVDANIRQAEFSDEIAGLREQLVTSSTIRQVLASYWDLWIAQQALEIQRAAREITEQNLANAEVRLEAGTVSSADIISLRMELSAVNERVLANQTLVRQRSIELARNLGEPAERRYVASAEELPTNDVPTLSDAVDLYREHSYELQQQLAAIESAKVQAQVARNQALPRLDATGSFSVGGLDRSPTAAFAQMGRFEGWMLFAGLRFEIPVNNRARDAEAERAELAVLIAETEYERLDLAITSRLTSLMEDINAARERRDLATQTAALAEENVAAQTARFEVGRATTFEVVDALHRHREAQLRVLELEAAILQQLLLLDDLTGQLFLGESN